MTATDIGREFVYPANNTTVLIALNMFFVLLELAAFAGLYGLFLFFLVLPALTRYLMVLLEARARGKDPGAPGVEIFMLIENAWSLFPVVHAALLVYATYLAGREFGMLGVFIVAGVLVALIPASLAVLAITRSPSESIDPRAVFGLIERCGLSYWIAPAFLMLAVILVVWLSTLPIVELVLDFVAFYFLFASFALIGGLIRPFDLGSELDIPAPAEPDTAAVEAQLEKERSRVLDHAYGFISRGNRAGGLQHIRSWIDDDPDPDSAWPWFVDEMLRWEMNEAALPFAQAYLTRLLHFGEQAAAVKLMLRCRLVNENFRPLAEDRALALAAAEHCQNEDLINFLR